MYIFESFKVSTKYRIRRRYIYKMLTPVRKYYHIIKTYNYFFVFWHLLCFAFRVLAEMEQHITWGLYKTRISLTWYIVLHMVYVTFLTSNKHEIFLTLVYYDLTYKAFLEYAMDLKVVFIF